MLRLRASFTLALLLAPLAARAQPDPALWRFVTPNAKMVIGIDWARLRQSGASTIFRQKLVTRETWPAFPGMEMLDSIDRVLISSSGKGPDDSPAADANDTPFLIAISGRFNPAAVRALFVNLGAKPQSYNSFQVYRPQAASAQGKIKDTAWVMFDAQTVLFGDAPSVFAALDRNQFAQTAPQAAAPGSLAARASVLDAKYELWIVLDASGLSSDNRLASLFTGNEWAKDAQGFEGGISTRAGLDADLVIHFSSEASAKRVIDELNRSLSKTRAPPRSTTSCGT